jgi:GST-like protein
LGLPARALAYLSCIVLATLTVMWTLYGSSGSGSAAIEMALLRCGLPFREVRASTWEADSAQEELMAANPMGQIPTLVAPDGLVLTESAAILTHLGLLFPPSGLLPADAKSRSQVIRGLVFVAANCYTAIGIIDYPERWQPHATRKVLDDLRQGARERLHQCWTVFADQFGPLLAGGPVGRRTGKAGAPGPVAAVAAFTPHALDLLAAVVSRWSGARGHLARARPEVHRALGQVETHPELQGVFARHWPPSSAST